MQNSFTIGDLADEFGVTLRTLRFYEAKDLLHPRRIGNNRLYSRRDRARLKLVLLGKRVGFSLDEMRDMIEAYDLKDGNLETLKLALSRFGQQMEALRRHKHDVEMAIGELTHTIDVVAGLIRSKEAIPGEAQLEAAE